MAVASSSTDVFLNFRGEDTRKSFVCHLHAALERQAVKAYIDSEDLRKGDDLSDLLKAIADSKFSIVVFSENYASSTWCLTELVQILKCKAKQKQIVVPVFYQVDPSDVRKQQGNFAHAFAKHESNKDLLQEVNTWRSALIEATNSSGWDSRTYKDDVELIDEIVDHVFNKLSHILSSKNNNLVGMDSHVYNMKQLLRLEMDDDVLKVGIWGMGGIGKTTIASEVYDKIRYQYDHCCFLRVVKEDFKDKERMHEKLLSGLMKKEVRIDTVNDGYKKMERLSKKKVLVVLDDVDSSDQIDTLLGHKPSFGGGSRIIVTTRDRHILNGFEKYKVELLSGSDAGKLFNRYAFMTNKCSGEYDHLSRCALEYAQGLPLALKILGAHLDNKSVSKWKYELDKMKKIPNSGIQDVLKTSYDGLDASGKNIFLDIACFFKGMHEEYAKNILDSCGFFASCGISALVEKALVTISKFGGLEMHDLLKEMGREIVHSESPKKPWKRSRLCYQDVQDLLTQNNKATTVEGIMVELSNTADMYLDAEAFVSMTNLRLLRITYPLYSNQFLNKPFRECFKGESWPEQLYQRNNCKQHLIGDLTFLSHKLKVLAWHGCPLKSLPSNFDPKYLVDLDMRYSCIEQLWEGTKKIKELISINLSCCEYLNRLPLCTEATKLEKLMLQGCISLLEVDPFILALENLVFLSLEGCTKLKSLPDSMHLKSLKFLNLRGCSNLEMFPEILKDMEALSELQLDETAIKQLPSSIERLRRLESLSMENCTSLVCLPDSICNLAELRFLDLRGCSRLHNLPKNFGSLESLLELELDKSGIVLEQLPVSILRLKLGRLSFYDSKQMLAPLSSWSLPVKDGPNYSVVVNLDIIECNLTELSDAIVHFSSLKVLRLFRTKLESLPAIMDRLVFLERLELEGCRRLKSIPELSSSISYINATDCTALETVSTPKRPYNMGRCFNFRNCSQLVQNDLFRNIVETHSPPQGNYSRPLYMCFPGSEIPERFIHQCRGSSVTAQLPPHWFDNKFLGFAICAVTNKPQGVDYVKLSARCFCTFKGDHCEYRFSFYLLDSFFGSLKWLKSNHMLLGYVPWSEYGMIIREEVNQRRYTEAKFEIELHYEEVVVSTVRFDPCMERCDPCIERCGVQFFFANNEEVVPIYNSERSLEGCSAEPSGSDISDEEEQYLKLSELFGGANRNSREYDDMDDESDCEMEDNYSSGKRKILSRWTQQVRVTSGVMQGFLDDGFSWKWYQWECIPNQGTGYLRSKHTCTHKPSCWAKSKFRMSIDDPTILEITYIGRHTCWETLPMLTHQVRATPGRELEGPFDGFSWGKYGQMDLPGAKYPRIYYVCTPQNVRGCMAIKEVQRSNDDPTILKITYRGRHTCIQASTDQVVQSPRSLGDNDSGENVTRLADRAMDDNNVNMSPDATSQDMDVNHMANKDVAGYPIHGGVVSEGTSGAVANS